MLGEEGEDSKYTYLIKVVYYMHLIPKTIKIRYIGDLVLTRVNSIKLYLKFYPCHTIHTKNNDTQNCNYITQ